MRKTGQQFALVQHFLLDKLVKGFWQKADRDGPVLGEGDQEPFSKFRAWGSNSSRRGRERLRSKLQGNDQEVGSSRRQPEAELEHQVPDRNTGRLPPGELQHGLEDQLGAESHKESILVRFYC